MIGFERWMQRRHELDSRNCHVERSDTSLVAPQEAVGSNDQRFFASLRMTEFAHAAVKH
jgi:hypothetical protein